MLAGFLATIWGRRIAAYEALNDPDDIIDQFGSAPLSDEEFFDNRIADYAVATERNRLVNDKKAKWLQYATYCLGLGILMHATFFMFTVF
jgi:hypothetical protein